jgi:hypothetical protein
MIVCDICNEMVLDGRDYSVATLLLREATKNGFLPSIIRDLTKAVPNPSISMDDHWKITLDMGAATDWSLCSGCYREVKAYLTKPESPGRAQSV